ncbi:leucine-rich repeat serine/threonine-protein kinase 1-like [Amphiura filiformis]|uniref:leucine-rich repeat serine/threonine-protein kinase 1-like n=1 Tax=Amphiura filiformis TaxID=82378 RepID=UPI003B20EA4B
MLKTVPSEIFMFTRLETLSLAHNHIDKIELANIEVREASQSTLEAAWRCSSLKQLDLSHNRLQTIPNGIQAATQLTKLYIASNKLKDLPQSWCCPLEKLKASNNSITNVPDIHLHWLKSLKFLDLSTNKLTAIPLPICRLSGLQDLNLSHNQIQALPAPMEWCTLRLSILDLSHNQLFHGDLDQYLDSALNTSNSLRSAFTRTLKKLAGDRNMDMRMHCDPNPTSMFYVDQNQPEDKKLLLEFPKMFADCLHTLNLNHNKLHAVPDDICDMSALRVLDLQGNPDLTQLPAKLSTLRDLYSIKVDQNQIKDPPEIDQILTNGIKPSQNIKRVLRERLHDSQPYRGVKLMIVGPQKSGKTSLMTQLCHCEWPIEDRGVNVQKWQPSFQRTLRRTSVLQMNQEEINFELWDLKGGDNYALVHQTLFTSRTLYLLVWDMSEKNRESRKSDHGY